MHGAVIVAWVFGCLYVLDCSKDVFAPFCGGGFGRVEGTSACYYRSVEHSACGWLPSLSLRAVVWELSEGNEQARCHTYLSAIKAERGDLKSPDTTDGSWSESAPPEFPLLEIYASAAAQIVATSQGSAHTEEMNSRSTSSQSRFGRAEKQPQRRCQGEHQ